ncbi:MAG: transglycosylase SLT domain-containing protein [Candidatus Aminicenantia bacterium]
MREDRRQKAEDRNTLTFWKDLLLLFSVLCFLSSLPLTAEIYTYLDENGRLVVTNRPSTRPKIVKRVSSPMDYDEIIKRMGVKYRIDLSLIHSIISAESNYNPRAVSPKGAIGLMQLMPETAKRYGVNNPYDPVQNIEGGIKYLKDLIKLYNGKTSLILAAYNAGQEAVKKYNGIPPYQETKDYIRKVMKSYNKRYIKTKTKIYRYYDLKGRLIITDIPPLPGSTRGKVEVIN